MKELIIEILKRHQQTFKWGSDGEYTTQFAVGEEDFNVVSDEIIQALTSVKSGLIERDKLYKLAIERYGNDAHLYAQQREGFVEGYDQAMHDFANNSEAIKENAIKFAKFISNNKNNEWDKLYNIYLTNKEK